MAKYSYLQANSIRELLDVARTYRQSGLLKVISSLQGLQSEGEIYLLNGQPFYARADALLGPLALAHLFTWRQVSFSFTSNAPRPPANIVSAPRTASVTTPLLALPSPRTNHPSRREQPVPQKRKLEHDTVPFPLTRLQRLVYFMVDGQRTIGDLAHCLNKSEREIKLILDELQAQELIVFL